jgi:molybdopterin-guanine dinucleotide biosynthesis protein MobB
MKIIQIVGLSNSGKTTFIKTLIPILKKKGRVAVIKHMGDHDFILEPGKDTTGFFDSGAEISAGIDESKTVISMRTTVLDDVLEMLSDQKIDFAIIEGFKQRSFPKIVLGDLAVDHCILSNPTTDEVVASLNLFQNFVK